jgi:hypothetical protein
MISSPPRMCVMVSQAADGDAAAAEGIRVWLASRDLGNLLAEAQNNAGVVSVVIDGCQWRLEAGKHFAWSAAQLAMCS